MPGFSFSPAMLNQHIELIMKSGHKVPGIVVEVNPAEIVLKHPEHPDRLIRINRDSVNGYTGFDDVKRNPELVELYLNRCFNQVTRCNGVKRLGARPVSNVVLAKDCPAFNDKCECRSCDFFKLKKSSVLKLLDDMIVGEYPQKTGKDEDEQE